MLLQTLKVSILAISALIFGFLGIKDRLPPPSEINLKIPLIQELPINSDIPPAVSTSTAELFIERGGELETKGETCVDFARRRSPEVSAMVARVNSAAEISATQDNPKIGGWILFYPSVENPFGHAGVVEEIKGDQIRISEANLKGDGKVSERWIPKDYPLLKGFRY